MVRSRWGSEGAGARRGVVAPTQVDPVNCTATAACAWHQHPHGMNEPLQQCFDWLRLKCSREKGLCDRADTFAAKLGHNYVRLNNKTVHVRYACDETYSRLSMPQLLQPLQQACMQPCLPTGMPIAMACRGLWRKWERLSELLKAAGPVQVRSVADAIDHYNSKLERCVPTCRGTEGRQVRAACHLPFAASLSVSACVTALSSMTAKGRSAGSNPAAVQIEALAHPGCLSALKRPPRCPAQVPAAA